MALEITVEPVTGPDAAALLAAYVAHVALVVGGTFTTGQPDDPGGLEPPDGAFLVARLDGAPVGCGGVRRLEPGVAEVKRMFVAPAARRAGVGRRLLAALEEEARRLGGTVVRLDTDEALAPAVALYERAGYHRIPPYNDNSDATAWFERRLA